MGKRIKHSAEDLQLLRDCGSNDMQVALAARAEFASAAEQKLQEGVLDGDVVQGIYTVKDVQPGVQIRYPLDILQPGTEREISAYTLSRTGELPHRLFESTELAIDTYTIGNAVSWSDRTVRNADWDVVARYMEIFEAGFTLKMNDDGWACILASVYNRGLTVFDQNAASGRLTLRLISLAQQAMARKGGGNSASIRPVQLTDIFMSYEGMLEARNWTLAEVPEAVRQSIFTSKTGMITELYGVKLHQLWELGAGFKYQTYYTDKLGGALASNDTQLAIGLDLSDSYVFSMPVREELVTRDQPELISQRMQGVRGWMELGFVQLDDRRNIALSF